MSGKYIGELGGNGAGLLPKGINKLEGVRVWPKHEEAEKGYEQLLLDDEDRKVLKDYSYQEGFRLLFHFNSTVLYHVSRDHVFYIAMSTYFITRFLNTEEKMTTGPLTIVAVIGGLMSFLIVFYVQQSYQRYVEQYRLSISAGGSITKLCIMMRNQFPPVVHWRLWRYLNAAHISSYTGLNDSYNENNFFVPLNEKYQLLTRDEFLRLDQIGLDKGGSACCLEIFGWCTELIFTCIKENTIIGDYRDMLTVLYEARSGMGGLYSYTDQPMPFPYIHFVNVMLNIYLPFHAYCIAMALPKYAEASSLEMVGPVVILLNCLFNLGLTGNLPGYE